MAKISKDTKVGELFSGKPKIVSWQRLWAFSGGPFRAEGWPTKNIHTDLDFAKSCGLPYVAASATQFQGYAVELMIDLFGIGWLSHGRMDVKFPNLVNADDILITKAAVQSKNMQGGATRFTLGIHCENQRGDKVLVGWAMGTVGKAARGSLEEYKDRVAELKADDTVNTREETRQLAPLEYLVTPELNQQYCYGEEDFKPWYVEETEFGSPIAHPGLILNWSNATRSPAFVRGGPGREGGVHTQDECFWYNPARVGKKIKVTWPTDFSAYYERRGRTYTISEILVVDEDGREIVRRLSRGTLAASPEQPYKKRQG